MIHAVGGSQSAANPQQCVLLNFFPLKVDDARVQPHYATGAMVVGGEDKDIVLAFVYDPIVESSILRLLLPTSSVVAHVPPNNIFCHRHMMSRERFSFRPHGEGL